MAISYSLRLGPPTEVAQAVDALLLLAVEGGLLPATTPSQDLTDEGVVLRSGMWCRLGSAKPWRYPWLHPVEESFGVRQSCWARFREDGDFDRFRQRDEMIWLVAGLLRALPGDMALDYENEIAWLVRKDGRLLVSDDDIKWTPDRLAMLPEPYERVALRFTDE